MTNYDLYFKTGKCIYQNMLQMHIGHGFKKKYLKNSLNLTLYENKSVSWKRLVELNGGAESKEKDNMSSFPLLSFDSHLKIVIMYFSKKYFK